MRGDPLKLPLRKRGEKKDVFEEKKPSLKINL